MNGCSPGKWVGKLYTWERGSAVYRNMLVCPLSVGRNVLTWLRRHYSTPRVPPPRDWATVHFGVLFPINRESELFLNSQRTKVFFRGAEQGLGYAHCRLFVGVREPSRYKHGHVEHHAFEANLGQMCSTWPHFLELVNFKLHCILFNTNILPTYISN